METAFDERQDGDPLAGRECLSFVISGPWAHFRRVEGNIVKQTYRIVPRTTVAGLLAAVLGIERDGYYELFAPGESAVAIEPLTRIRTMNLPMNTLSTAKEDMTTVPTRGKLRIGLPDPTKPRQQHNYEMLVDPAYRIDLWLSDDERFAELRSALEAGRSHYTPSLGLSECLAELDFHGTHEITVNETEGDTTVHSAVPDAVDDVIVERGTRCQLERSPAFMTTDSGGRTTTAFTSYAYNPDAEPLTVQDVPTYRVDDRTVMFV